MSAVDDGYHPVFGYIYNSNDMPSGLRGVIKEECVGKEYIQCIRVNCSNKQYINEITSEYIKYCKPPSSDIEACENTKLSKKEFDVFIMSGSKNYYWGEGILSSEYEDVNLKNQPRYNIKRVSRNRKPSNLKGIKRRRDAEQVISEGCIYEGEYYPSILEAKYAKFFKLAGFDAKHEKITVSINDNSYIPDFYIKHPFKAYIEIKPEEPPLDAMLKCEKTCELTGEDTYVLFKKNFGPPYDQDGRSYNSSNNIRAYKWYWKDGRVIRDESKYSFAMNENNCIYIDKCEDLNDYKKFINTDLLNLYRKIDNEGIEYMKKE
jgi:hypothetical protein